MPIKIASLKHACSLISLDGDEPYRTGKFADLGAELLYQIAVRQDAQSKSEGLHSEVHRLLLFFNKDLWNIETLFDRLDWQHRNWIDGLLPDAAWFRYSSADIDMFHVEARSLFDYLAQMIGLLSNKPGQTPSESFESLRNWALKDGNRSRIGDELADLLIGCDWFADVRGVRDDIVHRGAETLVFLEKPDFCFQVYQGHRQKIMTPEVMANENVVDFPRYAGLLYGYLLNFLEEFAETAFLRLGMKRRPNSARHHSSGISVCKKWMEAVLAANPEIHSKAESN